MNRFFVSNVACSRLHLHIANVIYKHICLFTGNSEKSIFVFDKDFVYQSLQQTYVNMNYFIRICLAKVIGDNKYNKMYL